MSENLNEVEKLEIRPFTKFCMSIGAVPSSYLAGLSIEEQLLWLCSYLEKEVIPTVNNNGESVEELQELFTELQSYVNNYFDNLDVQDEINNKLDAMATAGTLQEIISQYLNSIALFCFDSVNDMKDATNLIDGSYAKTLGYYSANDGGAALYKIVEASPSGYYETLDSGLYAELIFENNEINIKQFGCKCDKVTDDTTALQNAINQLSASGISKYTLIIPGISVITAKLQFSEIGTTLKGYNINKCGFKLQGVNSYVEFGGVNSQTYEINIRDMFIHGDYTQDQLLLFNKCSNIYLNRVYLSQAGQNKYLVKYINRSGMTWIKECIFDSSEDVTNYPAYCNGIYFDKMNSIFDMEGCNCWNLNNLLDFRDTTLQVNIHDNWIECCKQLFYHTGATDLRYMNLNIENNYFNLHSYSNFTPGTTNLITIDGTATTNAYNSYIKVINNEIYLWDTTLNNNTLINIPLIQADGTLYIVYTGNIVSGKNLNELNSYVCYINSNVTNTIKFANVEVNSRLDSVRLTNNNSAILCLLRNETSNPSYCAPNGLYFTKTSTLNNGNIYYDNGEFYGGYNGTIKRIPKRVGTAIPYATSSTNLVDYLNTLTTALVQSGIIDRQT